MSTERHKEHNQSQQSYLYFHPGCTDSVMEVHVLEGIFFLHMYIKLAVLFDLRSWYIVGNVTFMNTVFKFIKKTLFHLWKYDKSQKSNSVFHPFRRH